MSKNTIAALGKRAYALGLRIDNLGGHRPDGGRFWLVADGVLNWQTTTPGSTLDEIAAELDEREAELPR